MSESKSAPQPRTLSSAADLTEPRIYIGNLSFQTTLEELKVALERLGVQANSVKLLMHEKSGRSKGCAIAEFSNTNDAFSAASKLLNFEVGGRKLYAREDREAKDFTGKPSNPQQRKVREPREAKEDNGQQSTRPARGGRGGLRKGAMSIFGRGNRSNENNGENAGQPKAERAPREPRQPREPREPRESTNDGTSIWVGGLPFSTTDAELSTLFSSYGKVVSATIAQNQKSQRSKGHGTVKMSSPAEADAAIAAMNDKEHGGRKLAVRKDKF